MSGVLVYKTDITQISDAKKIAAEIRQNFSGCNVSFDLEDRDNVLRVESFNGEIESGKIKQIVKDYGNNINDLL